MAKVVTPRFVEFGGRRGSAGRGGAGGGCSRRTALVLPGVRGSPGPLLLAVGSAIVDARAVVMAVTVVLAGRVVNAVADVVSDRLGGLVVFEGGERDPEHGSKVVRHH